MYYVLMKYAIYWIKKVHISLVHTIKVMELNLCVQANVYHLQIYNKHYSKTTTTAALCYKVEHHTTKPALTWDWTRTKSEPQAEFDL